MGVMFNFMANTKKILTLDNEIVAQILGDLLQEREIPHVIKSYHDSALDGLFQLQKGWGYVEAPAEYEKEIIEIYRNISGGQSRD
jgi:hypothetical protein